MNANALKGLMVTRGFTVGKLLQKLRCEQMISMSKSAFYRKLNGLSEFDRREILAIAFLLEMSDNDIMSIFFDDKVSKKTLNVCKVN